MAGVDASPRMLNSWVHLLALSVFLGFLVALWVFVLSTLSAIKSQEGQVKFLSRSLKLYNPFQVGALGLLVLTGAFQITELKAAYRELFATELGAILSLKLILSFVIIILGTYQSMGVAHRFVRRCDGQELISHQELQSVTRRLRGSTLLILLLTVVTALVGMRIRG